MAFRPYHAQITNDSDNPWWPKWPIEAISMPYSNPRSDFRLGLNEFSPSTYQ